MYSVSFSCPTPTLIIHVSEEKHGAYDLYAVSDEPNVPMPISDEEQSAVVCLTNESIGLPLHPLLDHNTSLAGESVVLKRDLA